MIGTLCRHFLRPTLAAASLLLVGCSSPPPIPPATASVVASGPASPALVDASATAPADLELGAAGWFRLILATPDQDSLAGFDLDVGTLDGDLARRLTVRYGPLTPSATYQGALPVAVGPFDDVVLVAYWDGAESQVRTILVRSGGDALLLRRDDIVHALAYDPRTQFVYALTVDPKTRGQTSIVRFPLDRPTDQESIAVSDPGPDATQGVWTRLWVTPDGTRLVVLDCPDTCDARVLPTDGGPGGARFPVAKVDVVGVTNDEIVTLSECAPACPATRYGLSSGRAEPIGTFCEAGVLVGVGAGTALVSDWPTLGGCRDATYSVGRTDIATGERTGILRQPDRARTIASMGTGQGAAAPEGWFLLGPHGTLVGVGDDALVAPLLVRAEDGFVVQLPLLDPLREP